MYEEGRKRAGDELYRWQMSSILLLSENACQQNSSPLACRVLLGACYAQQCNGHRGTIRSSLDRNQQRRLSTSHSLTSTCVQAKFQTGPTAEAAERRSCQHANTVVFQHWWRVLALQLWRYLRRRQSTRGVRSLND